MKNILSVDTTSPRLRLAYGPDNGSPKTVFEEDVDNHGPGLIPRMDTLLQGAGLDLIDALVCCRGPGSFTGIRIGLSFAKTLTVMRNIPLFLVDTFALHFELAPQDATCVWVLLDARRGELYAQARGESAWGTMSQIVTIEDVLQTASLHAKFVGSGAHVHFQELESRFGAGCVITTQPDAYTLHNIAKKCVHEDSPVDPIHAEPLYLRKSDAELNFAAGRIRSAWSRVFPSSFEQEPS